MKKDQNIKKVESVDMEQEVEFRGKILQILSHKMLAMPYSEMNDANGVLLSQFSGVDDPDQLWRGRFRLFSSLTGTEKKNANLVGCEMLKSGEAKNCARLKKLPRLISIEEKGRKTDVFSLQKSGCFEFYVPFNSTKENAYVFAPDTQFSSVIECLSYDLYPNFLDQFAIKDTDQTRADFMKMLQCHDAMEFVHRTEEHSSTNFFQNHSNQHRNFAKNQMFKKYYAVFYTLEPLESHLTHQKVLAANDHFEKLAEKHQNTANPARKEDVQMNVFDEVDKTK